MAKRGFSNMQLGLLVIVLVVGGAFFAPQIVQMGDSVYEFFFGEDDGGGGGTGYDPTLDYAAQTFTLYKRGTTTAVDTADVYAWYDWDGNGLVKLDEYSGMSGGVLLGGEIETLASAATTGIVTTSVEYPVGKAVSYQIHKSGYEVETFQRIRDSIPVAHDGSALSVASCRITLTDTGATEMRIGSVSCVTESGDYNVTLVGDAEPIVEVTHVSVTADAGINEQAFTHWGTGKSYAGTFMGLTMAQADFPQLGLDGFDGAYTDGTNYYVWYWVDGYFNDADITNDQRFSVFFNLDIASGLTEADFDVIGFYNGVETGDVILGMWNTVLGTSETNIDVTQVAA